MVKQKLDRWAIKIAAESLPQGICDRANIEMAAELLANPKLLQPVETTAQVSLQQNGEFQFASNVTSACAKNNRVHGRLFPAGDSWQSKPLVLLVHGWNAELHYLYVLPRVARALNRLGLNAALIELPYHLHRRPLRGAVGMRDFISDDLPGMLLAMRQSVSDFHAFARWARAQGCPRVGVWGFSLGAWLVGLYVCQSDLASAAALTTPIMDLERAIRELSFCHPVRAAMNGSLLDLGRLNLTAHRPRLSPEAIFVSRSAYDLFVPAESYEQLAAAWKLSGWETVPQSHISVLLSRKTMKTTADWLARKLA